MCRPVDMGIDESKETIEQRECIEPNHGPCKQHDRKKKTKKKKTNPLIDLLTHCPILD